MKMFLVFLSVAGSAFSAMAAESEEMESLYRLCEQVLCRTPGQRMMIQLESGELYESELQVPLPIVQNDWVSILAGETVYIEAEVAGDRLANLRAVKEIVDPARTIVFRMWQEPNETRTMFSAHNPFDRPIKYHLGMMRMEDSNFVETSSCPVIAGGGAHEVWPEPLFQLQIFNVRLLESDLEQFTCEF